MDRKEPIMAKTENAIVNNTITNRYALELAEKHSISRLCVGREKLETTDIVGEVLTIEDADLAADVMIDGELTTFSVYTFKEYPGKFMYGGMKLTNIAPDLIDIAKREKKTIADLGIQIILKSVRAKNGNSFTDVQFI